MSGTKKVILIVEDEQQNRKLIRDVLQLKGYRTIEAVNGVEGVEMAKQYKPDLILMDVQLPVMDGIEATRIIKEDNITQTIPVVAITAYAMPGDKERVLNAGCTDYISKPVHIKELLSRVADYLEERNTESSTANHHE